LDYLETIKKNQAVIYNFCVGNVKLDKLKKLLKRIEERGLSDKIKVYTYSTMLSAHRYPHLRK